MERRGWGMNIAKNVATPGWFESSSGRHPERRCRLLTLRKYLRLGEREIAQVLRSHRPSLRGRCDGRDELPQLEVCGFAGDRQDRGGPGESPEKGGDQAPWAAGAGGVFSPRQTIGNGWFPLPQRLTFTYW